MTDTISKLIQNATTITVIQAENPDGDSLGTSLALEEILGDLGKNVSLYCPVAIPKYMRYIKGWDRVTDTFPNNQDLYIIVDTTSKTLLDKALTPANLSQLQKHPVLVIDHHATEGDLEFEHTLLHRKAVATSELVLDLANENNWEINPQAAENLLVAILSDSLGLMSEVVEVETLESVVQLVKLGAKISVIENARREYMKKSPEILHYKGVLLQRVTYELDGQLAVVHVPWSEIEQYSDAYNPGALVIDEMRLVEGVKLAVVIKTYPDGKITGKIRANNEAKIADKVAGFFGGGGHPYAAGFRVYESYDKIFSELIQATNKALIHHEEV